MARGRACLSDNAIHLVGYNVQRQRLHRPATCALDRRLATKKRRFHNEPSIMVVQPIFLFYQIRSASFQSTLQRRSRITGVADVPCAFGLIRSSLPVRGEPPDGTLLASIPVAVCESKFLMVCSGPVHEAAAAVAARKVETPALVLVRLRIVLHNNVIICCKVVAPLSVPN